jgi:tetratricopeptide (TPR) repeat protein
MDPVRHEQETELLSGERIAFVGRLAGMSRREAQRLVRRNGGTPLEKPDASAAWIVAGEADFPLGEVTEVKLRLPEELREAVDAMQLRIIPETQLWQRLGLVDTQQGIRRLYTPAMLADLLNVPVALIRRWHRRGLLVAAREVQKLAYFDYQEVATAKCLAYLCRAGCSARTIEKKVAEIGRLFPHIQRPLAELSVTVEGKQILVRHGEGLAEPSGQLRIEFEASSPEEDVPEHPIDRSEPATLALAARAASVGMQMLPDEMLSLAADLEEEGHLGDAAEVYRASLAAAGPSAESNFLLAEVLYRMGDLAAARERYYAAIELDEDFVEARANLGCVLAETGQHELAVAAFQGALLHHEDYPDVHYHLARLLDDMDRPVEAAVHWQYFMELAPESPWADQARQRLDETAPD